MWGKKRVKEPYEYSFDNADPLPLELKPTKATKEHKHYDRIKWPRLDTLSRLSTVDTLRKGSKVFKPFLLDGSTANRFGVINGMSGNVADVVWEEGEERRTEEILSTLAQVRLGGGCVVLVC